MKEIKLPMVDESIINELQVGDKLLLSGYIYCGRDAVLPKICQLIDNEQLSKYKINLRGSGIFHTAVSNAGVGPTSSNKLEIETSMIKLSKAGVKVHLGKGAISRETVEILNKYNSAFFVIPPITALLSKNIINKDLIAFPELGMEAFYRLEIKNYPAIVAAVHKNSIYEI